MDINNTSFEKLWIYNEFQLHFSRLNLETFNRIKMLFFESNVEDGLFSFSNFLYNSILKWSGFLQDELVYLATKVLVLSGLPNKARVISRGYEFHLGVLSWIVGSYFRQKQSNEFKSDIKMFRKEADNYSGSDIIIINDFLAWELAYTEINTCVDIYYSKIHVLINDFPLYILLERLIQANRIEEAFKILKESRSKKKSKIYDILLLNKESVLFQLTGKQELAIINLEKAEKIALEIGDFFSRAKINFNLGSSHFYLTDYIQAKTYWKIAHESYESMGDGLGTAKVIQNLATVANAQGDYVKSERWLNMSLNIYQEIQPSFANIIKIKLADLHRIKGEYTTALKLYEEYNSERNLVNKFEVTFKQSMIWDEIGNFDKSLTYIKKAKEIAQEIKFEIGITTADIFYAKYLFNTDINKSFLLLENTFRRCRDTNNWRGQILSLQLMSHCYLLKGNLSEANSHGLTSLEYSRNSKLWLEELNCRYIIALIYFFKKNNEKSTNLLVDIIYELNNKSIRNSIYYASSYLLLKIKISQNVSIKKIIHSLLLEIFDLIKISNNNGSLLWENLFLLLEIELLIKIGDIKKATSSLNGIREKEISKINYELINQIRILDVEISLVQTNIEFSITKLTNLEDQLLNYISETESIVFLVQYRLQLINLYLKSEMKESAYEQLNILNKICNENGFFLIRDDLIQIENLLSNQISNESQLYLKDQTIVLLPRV